MSERPLTIFVSAAEASGDLHASNLIRAILRRTGPQAVRLIGVGGPMMAEAGCELVADLTKRASMTGGPLLQLGYWYRTVRRLQRTIRDLRPGLHIPVDSPALNWHLAAAAKQCGSKVFYYIAPQVWAWAPWRVHKLARLTDHVGCILPFEERYLRHRNVRATYVGHPLFDTLPPRPDPLPDLLDAWSSGAWRVAILPGSRPGEIKGHIPAFLDAADAIHRRWPKARCTFTARTEDCAASIRALAAGRDVDIAIGQTRETLAASHFALAVSGTVTLETAWFGVPMVIVYRASRIGYNLIGRWLLRTPHLSLVNILGGRRIVPELMPWHGNRRQVIDAVLEAMDDLGNLVETRQSLLDMTAPLKGDPQHPASDTAAALALQTAGLLKQPE
jgi:lipid-A-disaccharide synthase